MPSGLVGPKGRYSEKAWGQAKDLASKSYDKPSDDASEAEKAKYWGTVNKITQNIQAAHGRKGRSEKKHEKDVSKKAGLSDMLFNIMAKHPKMTGALAGGAMGAVAGPAMGQGMHPAIAAGLGIPMGALMGLNAAESDLKAAQGNGNKEASMNQYFMQGFVDKLASMDKESMHPMLQKMLPMLLAGGMGAAGGGAVGHHMGRSSGIDEGFHEGARHMENALQPRMDMLGDIIRDRGNEISRLQGVTPWTPEQRKDWARSGKDPRDPGANQGDAGRPELPPLPE